MTPEQNAFLAEKLGWKYEDFRGPSGQSNGWDGCWEYVDSSGNKQIVHILNWLTPTGFFLLLEGMRKQDEGIQLLFCQAFDSVVMSTTAKNTPPFSSNWRAFIMLNVSPEAAVQAALKAFGWEGE